MLRLVTKHDSPKQKKPVLTHSSCVTQFMLFLKSLSLKYVELIYSLVNDKQYLVHVQGSIIKVSGKQINTFAYMEQHKVVCKSLESCLISSHFIGKCKVDAESSSADMEIKYIRQK